MKLYLDIDGVLLTKRRPQAADYAAEFIAFITAHFDCYWLTTHCKGDNQVVCAYLTEYFDPQTMKKLTAVKPTCWNALKTDAIDFDHRFVWLDDAPLIAEKVMLEELGKTDCLIMVDLQRPDELKRLKKLLSQYLDDC